MKVSAFWYFFRGHIYGFQQVGSNNLEKGNEELRQQLMWCLCCNMIHNVVYRSHDYLGGTFIFGGKECLLRGRWLTRLCQ